jgi:hypothetical protein
MPSVLRSLAVLLLAGLLSACATLHGPQSITLSAGEIEQRIVADLGGVLEALKGLDAGRPEVSLMPTAQRLLVEWRIALPNASPGLVTGVVIEVTGKPALNAARNGIDLTQVLVEDVRLSGLPRFLGLSRFMDLKGSTLPDLPLLTLPPDRLRQGDVAYAATAVSVGYFGLTIDIAPR